MKSAMIHPLAEVQTVNVGHDTRIWQFSVILKDAVIGSGCNICAHTFIENDVVLGDNVTVKNGVFLWDGTRIESNVFIGPNATFSNDKFPRSGNRTTQWYGITVKDGASIGANATLLPGITIGKRAMVGAGAVVVHNVPDGAVVVGNPARIIRYVTDD